MENSSETASGEEQRETDDKGQPSVAYWRSQLDAYDTAAKDWKSEVDCAFGEYTKKDSRGKQAEKSNTAHFPLFWACVRTILPAFYSRTPVIVTEKAFKEMRDPVARLAAVCAERLGKYAVRESNFDRSMCIAVTHYIMAEKASVRVIFEADISEQRTRTDYQQVMSPIEGPDGQMMSGAQYIGDNGQPYSGEVLQDEQGHYSETVDESIDYLKCESEPLNYRDYRHTANARHQGEIDFISFDTLLTRTECEEVFADDAAKLTYGPVGNPKEKDGRKEVKGLPTHYATITEIWDKKKRRVLYLSNGYNQFLKHVNNPDGTDPYKLKDFFPCAPFIIGTQGPDDMFPTAAYVQLEDLIRQVHGAFDRIRRLITALKKSGVYDASKSELAELNNLTSEGQFIGITDLDTLLGPGGTLEKLILFFPTDKIAQGVTELKTAMMEFKNEVYDLWGIPDIYRGISDPNETLGAQQMKGKHMSVRFSWLQRQVQQLARDTIEIMVDLYLGKCPDFKLAQIMGVQYMTPEEQQLFPQALALLKNDGERCIRLEIETDSTITQNLNADIEQKNYLAKTVFEGIGALQNVPPPLMPVAAKAVQLGVQALQQGKQVEEEMGEALEQMAQQAAQPQPPPPDPAMIKAQAEIQAAQNKAQLDAQLEQQKLQSSMQIEQMKAQSQIAVEERQTMADIAREDRRAQAKIASDQAMAETKMQVAMMQAQMNNASDAQKAQLKRDADEHSAKLDMITASYQAKLDMILGAAQSAHKMSEGGSKPDKAEKPRRRKLKITHNDEAGTADIEEILEGGE